VTAAGIVQHAQSLVSTNFKCCRHLVQGLHIQHLDGMIIYLVMEHWSNFLLTWNITVEALGVKQSSWSYWSGVRQCFGVDALLRRGGRGTSTVNCAAVQRPQPRIDGALVHIIPFETGSRADWCESMLPSYSSRTREDRRPSC
jgi:hypothetical protein